MPKFTLEYLGNTPNACLSQQSLYAVKGNGTEEQKFAYAEKELKKNGYDRKGRKWHEGYYEKLGNVNGQVVLYFTSPSTD